MSETPASNNTNASEIVQIDSYAPFRERYSCTAARINMDLFPSRPPHFLIAIVSSSVIYLARYERVAVAYRSPLEIIHEKRTNLSRTQRPNRFQIRQYRLLQVAPYRLQQMHQHETIQQHDTDRLKFDWRKEVTFTDK